MPYISANILIIEDEVVVAMDIQDCLSKIGHVISGIALTGEDGIVKAVALRPDLVLMDIKLEGSMDGITAAQAINKQLNIPVVFLTAYSDDQTLERAIKTGPFGYILKPVEENELRSVIDVALFKHRMESELREDRRWLQTILKTISDGVIATNNEGYITFMNPVAEFITGWRQEQGIGLKLEKVFTVINEGDDLSVRDILKPSNNSLNRGVEHFQMLSRDGKDIPIDWNVARIVNDEDQAFGFVLIFHDITKFRQAEAILENSRNELEKLVENRTMELQRINRELKEEINEREQIEKSLKNREIELETKSLSLEEMNTALKILIKSREEDKMELEEKVISNVNGLVLPYVEKLKKSRLDPMQISCLTILETHLKDIITPFIRKMAHYNLTPKEIQIASLIKEGNSTKEIAELLNIAPSSVDFHRFNIRNKLGLTNEKANLQSYLLAIE